jgi:hypothetical protein
MSDFEARLRMAMDAAVADAQPPPAVMELVRRRYRRRSSLLAAAAVAVVAVVAAAFPVVSALQGGQGRSGAARGSGAPLFPGGGRMLLVTHADLAWLYPDGRETLIAAGFAGAAPYGSKLLAWKHAQPPGASRFLPHGCFASDCTRIHDLSYYTMNLDGTGSRLVLPAQAPAGNTAFQYQDAQLSPDGSRLAYISQELRDGTRSIVLGAAELWSLDLATGQKTDLGPYPAPFAWKNNTTLLAGTPDGKSIQLVDARNGTRAAYLTVSDPRLARAYERARPGQGPPASIVLDGWNPGPAPPVLAVTADGTSAGAGRPAVILAENGRLLTLAPSHSKWTYLTIRLSASGTFLLNSQSGRCACPDLRNSVSYAGTVRSQQLSLVTGIPLTWDSSAVNPEGTVIAVDDAGAGAIYFLPVPSPACQQAGPCLHFQVKLMLGRGNLLAWEP